jgi:mono/diheme cytochrome c family protein
LKFSLLLVAASIAPAQTILDHGADVFAKTCASGYCHGPNGAGGGAPKLAGRGFDEGLIMSITRAGVDGTSMRGYGTVLARPDFNAVVAYVASLNGIEPRATAPEPKSRALSAQAARGRELFFDAVRGVSRCSTCHEADGMGIAVAPIKSLPRDLRAVASDRVRMALIDGDRFPALIVSQGGRRTVVFDLTTLPPVLRTVDAGSLKIDGPAQWRHPTAAYNDSELGSILDFLIATREK